MIKFTTTTGRSITINFVGIVFWIAGGLLMVIAAEQSNYDALQASILFWILAAVSQ